MQLELTNEEQQLLKEILESDLSDLRMEIRETDTREFRNQLKHKEEMIKKLLEDLKQSEE